MFSSSWVPVITLAALVVLILIIGLLYYFYLGSKRCIYPCNHPTRLNRLRLCAKDNQLYLGPSTAIISATTQGTTTYHLPDPGKSSCNFVLSESASSSTGGQGINGDVSVDGNVVISGDLEFTVDQSHNIDFAGVGASNPTLSLLGQSSTGATGGSLVVQAGDGLAGIGGNVSIRVGTGPSGPGQVLIGVEYADASTVSIGGTSTQTSVNGPLGVAGDVSLTSTTATALTVAGQITSAGATINGPLSASGVVTFSNTGAAALNLTGGGASINGPLSVGGLVTFSNTGASALTLAGGVILTNVQDHTIGFSSAPSSGAGHAITIQANDGAAGNNKGGAITVQAGGSSSGTSRGGLALLQGGNGSLGANGGTARVTGGTNLSGAGVPGDAQLVGGTNNVSGGNAGNVALLPGIATGGGLNGNIQLGITGSYGQTAQSQSINAFLSLYLLANNYAVSFQSPLGIYSTKTYASTTFNFGSSSTTSNIIATRIGNLVVVTWSTMIFSAPGSTGVTVQSGTGVLDVIYRPFLQMVNYNDAGVWVTVGGGTNEAAVVQVNGSAGNIGFTTVDGLGFGNATLTINNGGVSYNSAT